MKNLIRTFGSVLIIAILAVTFSGCSEYSSLDARHAKINALNGRFISENVDKKGSVATSEEEIDRTGIKTDPSEVLVVYFSCTNATKRIAGKIAELTGGDIYEIKPADPYTIDDLNYNDDHSRATVEQRDAHVRPQINGSVEHWDRYSTIYLGYPIWWSEEPRILDTFVESYDFKDKKIAPFCISGGCGVGSSAANLEANSNGGEWLMAQRFRENTSIGDIKDWIEEIGL